MRIFSKIFTFVRVSLLFSVVDFTPLLLVKSKGKIYISRFGFGRKLELRDVEVYSLQTPIFTKNIVNVRQLGIFFKISCG